MRTYVILKKLSQTKSFLPLNYFVESLQVSRRTVQKELSFIKKSGPRHGYQLLSEYGRGYSLEVIDKKQFKQFLATLSSEESVINEEQLVVDILIKLLTIPKWEYVAVSELVRTTGFSSTFLYSKLNTIDKFAESFNLRLERKSHFGIRLIGSDHAIRKLMLELYQKGDNSLDSLVSERVGNFSEYERVAEDCIRDHHLRIGYYEFQTILSWLKILVLHETTNQLYDIESNIFSLQNVPLKKLDRVLKDVAKNFQINISQEILKEFEMLVNESVQSETFVQPNVNKTYLKAKIVSFFEATDAKNGTDYSDDTNFVDGLVTHLVFLLERIDKKVVYKNPLLLELCIRYPLVFDLVLKFSKFLEKVLNIKVSNDELGFIAVHFLNHEATEKNKRIRKYERVAVICTTGGGVSNLIRTQIIGIFPEANVRAFSFWQENDIEAFGPDLIFSVIPLKHSLKVPILYIKELLTRSDIENIKQVLFLNESSQIAPEKISTDQNYLTLFKANLFTTQQPLDYSTIIQSMSKQIVEQGYGDSDFVTNVLKREKYMSTVYNNGIAMPHPIEMKGVSSAVGVRIVKPSISEKGKDVKLVFMVCLARDDFRYYSRISDCIFNLMQNEQKIIEIYNNPTFPNLISILKEMGE